MLGRARAPAAGTILCGLANYIGSAYAIELYIESTVRLDSSLTSVVGEIDGEGNGDTRLIERCVEVTTEKYGDGQGGTVKTRGEIPMAAGLKSSSAAANATILATLDALDVNDVSRKEACLLGVGIARDVGVSVTGAFDDASASMLGGLTVTDNEKDELITRESFNHDVLVWTPPERAYSAETDLGRCRQLIPIVEVIEDLVHEGKYGRAMTINGIAFSTALDFTTEPVMDALPDVVGVSLSGSGPSVTAIGERSKLEGVREKWNRREGVTRLTRTDSGGASQLKKDST